MRAAALLALFVLGACQPRAWPEPLVCSADPPPTGTVIASPILCAEWDIPGGEGRPADLWLANSRFAVTLRHPQDALTLAGVGGGTIIDAAPWESRDRLHEIAPLVGGGWLDVDEWEVEADGVRLAGTVVSLPDRPADTPGAWREVRWRVEPDTPWLHLEGADGLWVHAAGGVELLDEQIVAGDVVYGHDGTIAEDLGGALRLDGVTRVLIAPLAEAWGWLAEDPVPLSGAADGASSVLLYRDDTVVGRVPVGEDGAFAATIDASVTGVQARGSGRRPSPTAVPGEDLLLELGASGTVQLVPSWEGRPRALSVSWRADDGRGGRWVLDPDGATLLLGEGAHDLTLSAGPAWEPRTVRVELAADEEATLGVSLAPRFDPGSRVLAAFGWPADRSRTFRGSDLSAALLAAGAGYDYAAFTPEDEVASIDPENAWFPDLAARNGALLPARDGSWRVWSWNWSPNDKNNAHGVPDIAGFGPEDVLALAWGGPGRDRHTVVDLPWLEVAGAPFAVDPAPEMVMLDHPGADGAGFAPWYTWLDAGALLVPVGPYTWVEVENLDVLGPVDIEQGLLPGHVATGTGPLLTLSVSGHGPGDVAVRDDRRELWRIEAELQGDVAAFDRFVIVGDGGQVLADASGATALVERLPLDGVRWVAAVAWDTDGAGWAATGPVWTDPP